MRHSRNLSNKINRLHEKYLRIVYNNSRSSHPEVFLGKCVLRICSKFTGKHPCRSAISIKLQRDPKKNSTGVMELHPPQTNLQTFSQLHRKSFLFYFRTNILGTFVNLFSYRCILIEEESYLVVTFKVFLLLNFQSRKWRF